MLGALAPQVVEARALHDAEERLRRVARAPPDCEPPSDACGAWPRRPSRGPTVDGMHWSIAIMMSLPIASWVAMLRSGLSTIRVPST